MRLPSFCLSFLFAVREEQRCLSRRAARSFAKSSAVVRERQITLLWRRCQSSLPFSKNEGAILTYIDVVKTQVKWKVTIRKETLHSTHYTLNSKH